MHIVLGSTGHVGSAAAQALLAQGEPVTAVTRNAANAADLAQRGASIAVADVRDTDALRQIFRQGKRLFLLNPPADPSTDTDAEEHATSAAIVAALEGSGLEKVVALSTYGAQPGGPCGDLSVLYDLEQMLKAQPIPVSIIRAAYYMSNWDWSLGSAKDEGALHTMYPADLALPMVAPAEVGAVAARLLLEPVEQTGTFYVEGPERYSSNDVAAAFEQAIGSPVKPVVVPPSGWQETYKSIGFSDAAASSYARMAAVIVDGAYELPNDPIRGAVTLQEYIAELSKA